MEAIIIVTEYATYTHADNHSISPLNTWFGYEKLQQKHSEERKMIPQPRVTKKEKNNRKRPPTERHAETNPRNISKPMQALRKKLRQPNGTPRLKVPDRKCVARIDSGGAGCNNRFTTPLLRVTRRRSRAVKLHARGTAKWLLGAG